MTEFLNKRALITGAARGIGAAIALDLAERGADIAFTYVSSTEVAAELVRKIKAKGRRAFAIKADSADAGDVKRSVDEAATLLGGLDILVNNAGVLFMGLVEEMQLEHIDKILAVNIRAVVLASQAAIPHLKEGGRIVTIGSCLAERVAFQQVAVYSMSKSALLSFTRGLSRELGPRGITVNLIHPGPTETDMSPPDAPGAEAMRAQIALGRYGTDKDVAAAVAFIASPAARHITGTGLNVDGGMNA
ncbi:MULTISPECIES: SDR family oxidoreductase [Rhizobium]|uniref:SDR family oxidoreductase n=1 Tax=Rhizobium lusitanum TaxID=293958 RepID=A0A6L9UGS4_9HYPH|nr:SDR family oxidoreductase [Rhizobium lusitanum]NEI74579.1 SDR family oxidoreductase [Rhizobium lusitanum]